MNCILCGSNPILECVGCGRSRFEMAVFRKKHYEMVAKVLREESKRPLASLETIYRMVEKFERMFERDNPRFDCKEFRRAAWGD